ncbi:hypothetical protein B0H13DRAFT_1855253 [Mycena leptocephala]|nr:hypothetical protein B0H13DRAFT_1855253 [Mycena leptocephala]
MSREYLEETYSSFANPDETTLVLNATAGAGRFTIYLCGVIIYGSVADIPTKTQWEGRAGRSTESEAFCVQMIEPWAPEIATDKMPIKHGLSGDLLNLEWKFWVFVVYKNDQGGTGGTIVD